MSRQPGPKKTLNYFKKEADLRESLARFFLENKIPSKDKGHSLKDTQPSLEYKFKYNNALSKLCKLELISILNPSRPTIYRYGNINSFISENFEAIKTHLSSKGVNFDYYVTHHPCAMMFEPRLLQISLMKAVWLLASDGSLNKKRVFAKAITGENSIIINVSSKTNSSKQAKYFHFDDLFDSFKKQRLQTQNSMTLKLLNRNAAIHKGAFVQTTSHIGFSINKQLENSPNVASDNIGFYSEDSYKQILSNALSPLYYVFGV